MKKIISLLLLVILLAGCSSGSKEPSLTTSKGVKYDKYVLMGAAQNSIEQFEKQANAELQFDKFSYEEGSFNGDKADIFRIYAPYEWENKIYDLEIIVKLLEEENHYKLLKYNNLTTGKYLD